MAHETWAEKMAAIRAAMADPNKAEFIPKEGKSHLLPGRIARRSNLKVGK